MRDVSDLLRSGWLGDLTAFRELQLVAGLTSTEAAALCGVSSYTYRRWRTDRRPSLAALRVLAVVAGYVPWRGWYDWEMHNGYLFAPGYSRRGLLPGDILALPFTLQLLSDYRQQLDKLRTEHPAAEILEWRSL